MALPAQYSLMHSEYNEFLEALIGDGSNGMPISVISALARLDIDPWIEAARLSELTRDGAVAALGQFIGGVPDGAWLAADTPAIAARLTALLPKHRPILRFARGNAGKNGALGRAGVDGAGPTGSGPNGTGPTGTGPTGSGATRAGPGLPKTGRAPPFGATKGAGGTRWTSRLMTVALLVLLVVAVAAWFDATANRDSSLVQPDRDTTQQP